VAFDGQKYGRQTRKVWVNMPEGFPSQAGKRQLLLDIKQRGVKLRAPVVRFFFKPFKLVQGSHSSLLSGTLPVSQRKTKPVGGVGPLQGGAGQSGG